jgi:transcriptional regulator with XRE-family HTH domain
LRRERKLTLEQVSKGTGIPVSSLSRIENTRLALNVEKMAKLAKVFDLEVSELLESTQPQAEPVRPRRPMARRAIEKRIDKDLVVEEVGQSQAHYLFSSINGANIQTMYYEVSGKSPWDTYFLKYAGEKSTYIIEGRGVLYSEFYTPQILEAGDAIFIDCDGWHCLVAAEDCDVVKLFVVNYYDPSVNPPEMETKEFTEQEWNALTGS